jgi:Sec-independent protein translocase protein TatA
MKKLTRLLKSYSKAIKEFKLSIQDKPSKDILDYNSIAHNKYNNKSKYTRFPTGKPCYEIDDKHKIQDKHDKHKCKSKIHKYKVHGIYKETL